MFGKNVAKFYKNVKSIKFDEAKKFKIFENDSLGYIFPYVYTGFLKYLMTKKFKLETS